MSRIDRLREYARPASPKNWCGASRDEKYIDRWSERAHQESDGYKHRASDGPMELPDTGKMKLRETSMRPLVRDADRVERDARADLNHVGSLYMRYVRRNA
jgi:hypothetical protein